jgi:hypothetical protein
METRLVDLGTGAVRARWTAGDVARLAFAARGQFLVTAHDSFKQEGVLRPWQVSDRRLRTSTALAPPRCCMRQWKL